MGIDMSSAFDTIRRTSILELLAECGCDDDEVRLVRLLLSDTKLRVNFNDTVSLEFQSFLGAFWEIVCQGAYLPLCWLVPSVISESNSSLKFTGPTHRLLNSDFP